MNEKEVLQAHVRAFLEQIPQDLIDKVTVVGGAALALHPGPEIVDLRLTQDIDVVVGASKWIEWRTYVDRFEQAGFQNDAQSGLTCRYRRSVDSATFVVDILPSHPEMISLRRSRWFNEVPSRRIKADIGIHVVEKAHLMALKIEAYFERGIEAPESSKDLEDIVALVMNHADLVDDIIKACDDVLAFCKNHLVGIFNTSDGWELFSGHLPGDDATQHRGKTVFSRFSDTQMRRPIA